MDNEKIIVSIEDELKEIYPLVRIKYNEYEYLFYLTDLNNHENIFVGKIINDSICPVVDNEFQELIKIFKTIISKIKNT